MRKKLLSNKIMKVVNFLAMGLIVWSANSACFYYLHEPEFPEAAKKFKKLS